MFSLICALLSRWVNNRAAGDLRRHRAHYDVFVMHTQVHHMTDYTHAAKWQYLFIL